jgi:hypothetical protein
MSVLQQFISEVMPSDKCYKKAGLILAVDT